MAEPRWDTGRLYLLRTALNYGYRPPDPALQAAQMDTLTRQLGNLRLEAAQQAGEYWKEYEQSRRAEAEAAAELREKVLTTAGGMAQQKVASAGGITQQKIGTEETILASNLQRLGTLDSQITTLGSPAKQGEIEKMLQRHRELGIPPTQSEVMGLMTGLAAKDRAIAEDQLQAAGIDVGAYRTAKSAALTAGGGTRDEGAAYSQLVDEGRAELNRLNDDRRLLAAGVHDQLARGVKGGIIDPNYQREVSRWMEAMGLEAPPTAESAPEVWQAWADTTFGKGQVSVAKDEMGQLSFQVQDPDGQPVVVGLNEIRTLGAETSAKRHDDIGARRLRQQLKTVEDQIAATELQLEQIQKPSVDPYTQWYQGVVQNPNFQKWKAQQGLESEVAAVDAWYKMARDVDRAMKQSSRRAVRGGGVVSALPPDAPAAKAAVEDLQSAEQMIASPAELALATAGMPKEQIDWARQQGATEEQLAGMARQMGTTQAPRTQTEAAQAVASLAGVPASQPAQERAAVARALEAGTFRTPSTWDTIAQTAAGAGQPAPPPPSPEEGTAAPRVMPGIDIEEYRKKAMAARILSGAEGRQ